MMLISVLCLYSQKSQYNLKVKFNEKDFLSEFLVANTQNKIINLIISQSDSIWAKTPQENYTAVFGKTLIEKAKLKTDKDVDNLSDENRKEWDAMKSEILKSNVVEMYEDAINRTFDRSFLEGVLRRNNVPYLDIEKTAYNEFVIHFQTESYKNAGKSLFTENILKLYPVPNDIITTTTFNCIKNNIQKKYKQTGTIEDKFLAYDNEAQLDFRSYIQELSEICSPSNSNLIYFSSTPKGSDYKTNIYVGEKYNSESLFKNMKIAKAVYDINYKGKESLSEEQALEYRKKDKILFSFKENNVGDTLMKDLLQNNKNNGYILAKSDGNILLFIKNIENQKNGNYGFEINASDYYWEPIYQDILFEVFKNFVKIKN